MDFTWVAANPGDITGVTAGTGISGGGTSGTVTVTNDMATTITASGDIVVGTGSGTYDNLPIGSTGQVLTADTTVSPYKVKWQTPSSGGMTLLSTTNLLGATVSISSISGSYNKLFVLVRNPSLSSAGSIFFKFNTSTAPLMSGVDNGVAYAAENGTFLPSNATNPLILQFEIANYANTSYAKSIIGSSCGVNQSDGAVWGGYINTNSAITNITFTATSPREYEAGDVLIYGVK
jgi:hypothetical protein